MASVKQDVAELNAGLRDRHSAFFCRFDPGLGVGVFRWSRGSLAPALFYCFDVENALTFLAAMRG